MIKVAIADDEEIIREGIRLILEQDKEIEVVCCIPDGLQAFEKCRHMHVDLVLMDINAPNLDGIQGIKLIKSLKKPAKILVLTNFFDENIILGALKSGADGYIFKSISASELISAVKSIVSGLRIIHHKAYNTILKYLNNTPIINDLKNNIPGMVLNDRERHIIELITQGKTNKEIASDTYLSEGRIKNMITAILLKAGVNDRTQLAVFAVKNGLA